MTHNKFIGMIIQRNARFVNARGKTKTAGRNKLDNSENYGKSGEKRAALARAMRQDVLTLMDRRDAAARALGFSGYDAAILQADGISRDWLWGELGAYLDRRLPDTARRVRAEGLSMDRWFSWIAGQGALGRTLEPLPLLEAFGKRLGMVVQPPRRPR